MHVPTCSARRVPFKLLATGMLAALGALSGGALRAVDGLDDNPGAGRIFGFDLGADSTDQALACAAHSDGRIVLAGRASDDDGESSKIALARIRLDGTLDPAFGVGGKVAIDMSDHGLALDRAGARAVVIDDTRDIRHLLCFALSREGMDVVGEAGDGQAGVELVREERPDLPVTMASFEAVTPASM